MIAFPTDHSEEERKFLLAAQNSERAKTILNNLPKPKRAAVSPAIKQKMDRADRDDISNVEKLLLFREVLGCAMRFDRGPRRLFGQYRCVCVVFGGAKNVSGLSAYSAPIAGRARCHIS